MEQEQKNFIKIIIEAILFHAKPSKTGWKSNFNYVFTEDEKREMEKIIKDL